ncbi:uncharacterized protein [Notothenia coriiceps]|uniref:Uncharacterized protein LOC104945053 n=1 Tax=Notothenia coriiceps TaxID=8208 RepID=A0A6I9N0D6_9TELE|nr:PREDICTED: uncharacterized protein LOC104945053 [Notothenia coriiceps]XP_010768994.1 PREDICTED: uncharacterized protein LOC104945053 [Notothenia coriiceps]
MEGTKTSLWLFLLLSQLLLCPTDANQDLSTTQPNLHATESQESSLTTSVEPSLATNGHTNPPEIDMNGTRADCLIDTEMGLIAIGSAGGLIVCLLVAVVVLACQVYILQRRHYAPRHSGGAGYWDVVQSEDGGLVGPCDSSIMLEEIKEEGKMEEERQASEEAGAEQVALLPQENTSQMQSTSSRYSSLEVPRDLENMPLVV